jgi:hypothetical protein
MSDRYDGGQRFQSLSFGWPVGSISTLTAFQRESLNKCCGSSVSSLLLNTVLDFKRDVAGHKIGVQAGVEPTIDCFIFY